MTREIPVKGLLVDTPQGKFIITDPPDGYIFETKCGYIYYPADREEDPQHREDTPRRAYIAYSLQELAKLALTPDIQYFQGEAEKYESMGRPDVAARYRGTLRFLQQLLEWIERGEATLALFTPPPPRDADYL